MARNLLICAVSLLVLLIGLALAPAWTSEAGDSRPVRVTEVSGDQRFPPANLTHEREARALAGWLNETLGLNATIGPSVTPSSAGDETSFFDGFNKTMTFAVNASGFENSPETVVSWSYARSTHEFVGLDVRFAPYRPLGPSDLRGFSISLAASLGMPLTNATYVEYSTGYFVPGSNGSADREKLTRYGKWLETRGPLRVDFANQLLVFEDVDTHAVQAIRAFRWIENLPPIGFTISQVVRAASDVVNRSYGARTFTSSGVGLTPNWQNLTWSFFVELGYPYDGGGSETFVLLMDVQTISFQRVVDRIIMVVDSSPSPPYLLGAMVVAASVLVLVAALGVVHRRAGRRSRRRRWRLRKSRPPAFEHQLFAATRSFCGGMAGRESATPVVEEQPPTPVCPNCGASLRLGWRALISRANCPKCGVVVPRFPFLKVPWWIVMHLKSGFRNN